MVPPLHGLRVVDLTRHLPGPLCTLLLADLGAEVIKVEEPKVGDPLREVPPFLGTVGSAFLLLNRGKKSVALDLRQKEGRRVLSSMVRKSVVLVQGFRPHRLAPLGLTPEIMLSLNPRLVYCSITGFGLTGRPKDRPGHDINFSALAGILSANTDATGRPRPPSVPVTDVVAGVLAALAIVVALRQVQAEGRGQLLDLSLLDAGLLANVLNLAAAEGRGRRPLSGVQGLPSYGIYGTSDGAYITLAALEQKFWTALCRVLGWGVAEASAVRPVGRRREEIRRRLAKAIARRPLRYWSAAFTEAGIPHAPVRKVSEVLEDQGLRDRGTLRSLRMSDGSEVRVIRLPSIFSGTSSEPMAPAPTLGQDSDGVLRVLGFRESDLKALRRAGVVGGPSAP